MDLFTYKISADYQIVLRVRFWGHKRCAQALFTCLRTRGWEKGSRPPVLSPVHSFHHVPCGRQGWGFIIFPHPLPLAPGSCLGGGQIKDVCAERVS